MVVAVVHDFSLTKMFCGVHPQLKLCRGSEVHNYIWPLSNEFGHQGKTSVKEKLLFAKALGPKGAGCQIGYNPSVSVWGLFQLNSFVERLHHTSDGQLLLMSLKMISSPLLADKLLFPLARLQHSSLCLHFCYLSYYLRKLGVNGSMEKISEEWKKQLYDSW